MTNKERILKNRIYILILCAFIYFIGVARLLKPYEEHIRELDSLIVLLGISAIALLCIITEYIVFLILRKHIYKD